MSHPLHLVPASPSWPRPLSEIPSPPRELWVRGRVEILGETPRLAIVGTRSPTPYGEAMAALFARYAAVRGVAVVSGLARGVDQTAHAAALEVEGSTLAVLGSGVDRPWPRGELARRVGTDGLLVSEYPPECGPRRHHFPLRNRLIAGLADGVLVVEAGAVSGSLITAHWAADQGRSVFALPGRVDQPMARGCHRLLREGAGLVETPEELFEELGWEDRRARRDETEPAPVEDGAADPLVEALRGETLSADELAQRTERPLDQVLAALVEHELAGRIARAPGGLYRRA